MKPKTKLCIIENLLFILFKISVLCASSECDTILQQIIVSGISGVVMLLSACGLSETEKVRKELKD